ncbi:SAV_915 family protein [Streptomyces sp. x-80]|uniref:SAV_915 family protein n=1 Tax=Streptomyces sp. x-80 TaxID=2789282 RepID=UPI00398094BB
MSHTLYAEDPEPAERVPAGPLFVPVRPGPAGCTARLFRTPFGGRTAVGFTSPQRLAAALGGGQPWIRLSEHALRALAEPVGATGLTVDPRLTPAVPRMNRRDAPPDRRDAPRTHHLLAV